METNFDFDKKDNICSCKINSNIQLRITNINNGVAIMYFTDENDNKINIPNGLVVTSYDELIPIIQKPFYNDYILYWTDDYVVEFNNNIVIQIKNKRTWNIKYFTPSP
jgi:hypothetical protein